MTNSINNLLTPVPERLKCLGENKSPHLVGNYIDFPDPDFSWEDLRRYAIVLIGFAYDDNERYLNNIREEFYSLYIHKDYQKLIDLGNVLIKRDSAEDIEKIEKVLEIILKYNVFIIPFGKSPIYLNYCFNALKTVDNSITVTHISNSASLGSASDNISRQNHLAHLLEDRENSLFSLNILAYQLYQTDPESLDLLNNYYCQMVRLGSLRSDIKSIEPILRDTDILGFNLDAVRQSDSPASLNCSPNGLYAEEICQIARYGGISDRLHIAGVFGFSLEKDQNSTTSQLIAQIIWHLIDGYISRKNDSPLKNINGVKKYIVDMGAPMHQLVFYYSDLSERWWLEVPGDDSVSGLLVACSPADYRAACNHEVPFRWVWFHQKISRKNNSD